MTGPRPLATQIPAASPDGPDHHRYCLWTEGHNNFRWQDIALPDPDLLAGTLARGAKVRGHVRFAVKATARGFTVGYEPLVIFGGYQKITVNLGA